MEDYFAAKAITDKHLEDVEREIDDALSDLREKGHALTLRHEALLKREQYLSKKNESHITNVRGADMMRLNVGGKKMKVRRDTLRLIQGSRMEKLFSGVWDEIFLRDDEDYMFLDIDPAVFQKIIEYLYLVKTVRAYEEDNGLFPDLPEVRPDQKAVFDAYIKFFGLDDGPIDDDVTVDTNISAASCTTQSSIEVDQSKMKHENILDSFKNEGEALIALDDYLVKMEKKLKEEEDFFAFFTNKTGEYETVNLYDEDCEESVGTDSSSDAEALNSELTIMKLWLDDDDLIAVKRSTLCICKESFLAKQFSNKEWIEEHTIKDELGNEFISIEHSPSTFKAIICKLRLCAILRHNDEFPDIIMSCKEDAKMLGRVEPLLLSKLPSVSSIIKSPLVADTITSWLIDDCINSFEPNLVYRASRDGWKADDLNVACDGVLGTFLVIKTTTGCIFGGYSVPPSNCDGDTDAQECTEGSHFIFSLKSSGLPPMRFEADACPRPHGPMFLSTSSVEGCIYDLKLGSKGGNLKYGTTRDRNTRGGGYASPFHTTDSLKNTRDGGKRSKNFRVEEIEVFGF